MEQVKLKGRILYHIVLVTKGRVKMLYEERVFPAEAAILRACNTVGCSVIEMKVMSDHVHITVESDGTAAPLIIERRIAHYIREAIDGGNYDMWRKKSWVQTVYPETMQTLIDYIKNNKEDEL